MTDNETTETTDTTETTETSSEDETREKRRWRDDPLSVFLAFAALILALMYFVEQSSLESLDEAAVRAHELGAGDLDLEGCTVGSASAKGMVLVVSCQSTAEDAARRAAEREPTITGFESVLFVGTDGQLACSTQYTRWPDGCERRDRPVGAEPAKPASLGYLETPSPLRA